MTYSGSEGEKAAARYLKENGYGILKTNYRVAGSEVDIIAVKDDTLCFVEVKTRETDKYGLPEEFVGLRKRKKMIRAATIFSSRPQYENFYLRFDIISILDGDDGTIFNHIQHAFDGNLT